MNASIPGVNAHAQVWDFKNELIRTQGEVAKTRAPPKFSAPDPVANKQMLEVS